MNLAYNSLQWLICHQNKPNRTNLTIVFLLTLLILAAVISLSLLFLTYSPNPWIFTKTQSSILTSPLPHNFLDIYSLSMSSPGSISSFLFFGSFIWVVHFKNGPKYLTIGTTRVFFFFIALMRFLRQTWFEKFLFFLCTLSFSFTSLCMIVSAFNIPRNL